MVVRIAIGLFLLALVVLGGGVLFLGTVLHFQYADASDPPHWAVQRSLWLAYLSALNLFWGASAVSLFWPHPPSAQLRRVLSVGAIAVSLSGGVLLAVSHTYGAGRFYMELAGLIVFSGIVAGTGQILLSSPVAE